MMNSAGHYGRGMTARGTDNILCCMTNNAGHYSKGDDSWGH
jgi:hypothetical protein